jgi:hypothetical protein
MREFGGFYIDRVEPSVGCPYYAVRRPAPGTAEMHRPKGDGRGPNHFPFRLELPRKTAET